MCSLHKVPAHWLMHAAAQHKRNPCNSSTLCGKDLHEATDLTRHRLTSQPHWRRSRSAAEGPMSVITAPHWASMA